MVLSHQIVWFPACMQEQSQLTMSLENQQAVPILPALCGYFVDALCVVHWFVLYSTAARRRLCN